MSFLDSLALIKDEAKRVSSAAPGTIWYFFGSILRNPTSAADIDVAVLCPSHETARVVRRETANLCAEMPLHLFLLTEDEDTELGFLASERCQQFYP